MDRRILFVALLFIANHVLGQHIKVDNGVVISTFTNKKDLPILSSNKIKDYSFLLGFDYLEKRWFYLSSQIGYLKTGGRQVNPLLTGENEDITESRSYIHTNTTFRGYVKSSGLMIFAGVGPYLNILTGPSNFESSLYKPYYNFKKYNVGARAEIGINKDINRFRFGIIGSYMRDLSPSASSEFLSLYNNSFSGSLTIGYSLW
ncbi:hypothetical protein GCM10028803_53130 [Larkinella knui]|uniref:Outer membrane protein beta-barrel domain-containing protein n=1 Tax=Larkinella knui TaxID=2025310 RepID=A0A3P1CGL0_9BACT|nr:hypothetical protein [Larkinella knui]RRB12481.1 hypothetical protein EHT87_19980 [Larkinella knui]